MLGFMKYCRRRFSGIPTARKEGLLSSDVQPWFPPFVRTACARLAKSVLKVVPCCAQHRFLKSKVRESRFLLSWVLTSGNRFCYSDLWLHNRESSSFVAVNKEPFYHISEILCFRNLGKVLLGDSQYLVMSVKVTPILTRQRDGLEGLRWHHSHMWPRRFGSASTIHLHVASPTRSS